jgi:hypothetical protein
MQRFARSIPTVRIPLAPPTRLRAILSPPGGQPAEAQESRPLSETAVHLGLVPEARNLSLMPGLLRGCSLRPFGTRPNSEASSTIYVLASSGRVRRCIRYARGQRRNNKTATAAQTHWTSCPYRTPRCECRPKVYLSAQAQQGRGPSAAEHCGRLPRWALDLAARTRSSRARW